MNIEISEKNLKCWEQYKLALAEKVKSWAEERDVVIGDVDITDNEAISGLFDCIKEEGIFCWGLLWCIIERTAVEEEGE
jgi:DUF971 family protein